MNVIPVMCRAKLDIYVFIDLPVFIPWTHQMKVIPGMCRAKLDSYVFIDFPVFIPWAHQMKVIPGMCRVNYIALSLLTFQYLYHGRTRWRLFQGCVVLN
jgi:hypothetical protein